MGGAPRRGAVREATGTLPLTDKTAAMVDAGILCQPPDSSRLPVGLRLIVLNQKAYRILPFLVPALRVCLLQFVENPKTNL